MEAYLEKCLGSFPCSGRAAELTEIIVVNDGSTDSTLSIARRFEKSFPEVFSVIDKKNGHYGSCINAALAVAKGIFIKTVDADDYVSTDAFARFVEKLDAILRRETQVPELVFSDFDTVNPAGRVIKRKIYKYPQDRLFGISVIPDSDWRFMQMQGVAWNTEYLRSIGYVQTEGVPYTDQEWVFTPFFRVSRIAYIHEKVYKYLIGRDGQSVEGDVFARSIPVFLKLAKNKMEVYAGQRREYPPENRSAVDRIVFWTVSWIYVTFIVTLPKRIDESVLEDFDAWLKAVSPETYAKAGNIVVSRFWRYKCVAAWRRNRRRNTFSLFAARSVMRCLRTVYRVLAFAGSLVRR